MRKENHPDYSRVSELPGEPATREQCERLYQRYKFSAGFCQGKDVLEIACGAGFGLSYIAGIARSVKGLDVCVSMLAHARKSCGPRVALIQGDGCTLPFQDSSFDVIMLHEALYYLHSPDDFLKECSRVLRKGGIVLITTVNKDWDGFNPSAYSVHYFSLLQLSSMLARFFSRVQLYGGFPSTGGDVRNTFVNPVRKMAVRAHMVPQIKLLKHILKKIFLGKMTPLPEQVFEGMASYQAPDMLNSNVRKGKYKIMYALAYK